MLVVTDTTVGTTAVFNSNKKTAYCHYLSYNRVVWCTWYGNILLIQIIDVIALVQKMQQ